MHRKFSGLSQNEAAFLTSSGDGAKISRYEHFTQQPTLESAIALEILFRTPVRKLFAGVSRKVERRVIFKAKELHQALEKDKPDAVTIGKIELLESLCCELGQMHRP